jgi:hypothetical protein
MMYHWGLKGIFMEELEGLAGSQSLPAWMPTNFNRKTHQSPINLKAPVPSEIQLGQYAQGNRVHKFDEVRSQAHINAYGLADIY